MAKGRKEEKAGLPSPSSARRRARRRARPKDKAAESSPAKTWGAEIGETESWPIKTRGEEKIGETSSPIKTWGEEIGETSSPIKTWGEEVIWETEPATVARGEVDKAAEEEGSEEEDEEPNYFPGIAVELGNCGIIAVLFETPSGFAIFNYDGVQLFLPLAVEHIWTEFVKDDMAKTVVWLKEFQIFEDKASAINPNTGVDARLASMIKRRVKPKQKLAVGSYEHAQIIEENLGISCLYNDAVMELMWGLKNCMNSLVPGELIKGDRPSMCKGMRIVLDKYGFDYKPEMVNDDLTQVVCVVCNCDYGVQKHFDTLHQAGKQLMNISEINCKDWDLLKLATALKWVSCPEEPVIDPGKIFSEDECNRLERDAPKYEDKLWKWSILAVYNQMLEARIIRNKWLSRMNYFLKEAEEECKAEQVMSSADPVH